MSEIIQKALDLMKAANDVPAVQPGFRLALETRAQTYVLMDIAASLRMMAYPLQCLNEEKK